MKYKAILADPPWRYQNSGCRGACENHYNTMQYNDIKALPVSQIADQNAVLFLWCTWPMLVEGIDLINAWGFIYKTGFPWVKIKSVSKDLWGKLEIKVGYGIGFWVRGATEMVLIGTKGSPAPSKHGFIGLLSPNLFHSRKPESLYEYIETLEGPYLELFARSKRKDWTSWGNEVETPEDPDLVAILSNQRIQPTQTACG